MDLTALSAGLASLKNSGIIEKTFSVQGMTITLSSLTTGHDLLIAKKLADISTDGLEYIQTYKLWIAAFSVCQINEFDLRKVETIDGNPPKAKEEYVFDLLSTWSRPIVNVIFKKYGEVLVAAEKKAEEGVKYEVIDVDAEIARVEERLKELQEQKSAQAKKEEHVDDTVFAEEKKEAAEKA